MTDNVTKIAIYGVGLMGGSLALCFKGKPGLWVTGHSPNPASVQKYLEREVVDEATTSFEQAALGADFIFLCVPVGKLEEYLDRLMTLPLKPSCIITDVGSTKASVVASAQELGMKEVYFIGGHPMAGSERSGVEAASSYLYENAFYVLTPLEATPDEAYRRLEELLRWTRAHIIRMDPRLHDDIVGAISHLPHIIAVALVNQIAAYNKSNPLYESLAAGGFRDITRIASSDPVMWRDILVNNREVLLKLLRDWNDQIDRFTDMLEAADGPGIEQEFIRAGQFRSQLPERRKGVMTSHYDLYIDVPDHPGIVGNIAGQLGSEGINLRNIQIIESRADVPGVLRLSFGNEKDFAKAAELLKKKYTVHY
ncbi:prephenate dehydrogenase [Paenibacillus sp. J2TS4]|uniref:prephenate dehydrogenase n=1 Tax=Paenibacillus sp. J2TS4 TaxID=2807194 RepID=UPI001B18E937|nr:prephenate dehydrogenase [Paenibacillus sp. J2TS4]GIP32405.1 prephenate dehydrogenase [Paenibacillus sp. J2TS4]